MPSNTVKDSGIPVDPRKVITKNSDGTLTIDGDKFSAIPTGFADTMVKHMKTGAFWESIVVVDAQNFMRADKFKVYKELAGKLNQ